MKRFTLLLTVLTLAVTMTAVAQNQTAAVATPAANTTGYIITWGCGAPSCPTYGSTMSVEFGPTCATGSGSYSTCITTYPLPFNMGDFSYSVTCALVTDYGNPVKWYPAILNVSKLDFTHIQVVLVNGTSNGAQISSAPEVDCTFRHN